MDIIIPVLLFGAIGLAVGIILSVASKLFAVKTDERIDMIAELLPGANCGGCGYAGCSACAAAIVEGKAPVNACPGCSNTDKIAEIMGVEATSREPQKAFVLCSGIKGVATKKYDFDGSLSCYDISQLKGGDKQCEYACLGYGDCVKKCAFNALSIEDGVAMVDENKCTGCGVCATVCPKSVIKIMPAKTGVFVKCSSKDKGAALKDKCSAGCIGCRICEKNCEAGAIAVTDNLAVIDVEKCTGCGVCTEKCPKKIIKFS